MAKKEKERKYRMRRGGFLFALVAAVLIAVSIVAACTVFFRVETVTVEGNERYTADEILSAASVEMGANLILTPGEQIAQRVYEALPYVDTVQVEKHFPTTLNLVVTETKAAVILQGTASAWLADAGGKLLEPYDGSQEVSCATVTGLELLEPAQGEAAQTTPENQERLTGLVGLTQALKEAEMLEEVTSIDVTSSTEIIMVYQGRLTVKLLNGSDYESKLRALEMIVATIQEDDWGTVNMKGKWVVLTVGG